MRSSTFVELKLKVLAQSNDSHQLNKFSAFYKFRDGASNPGQEQARIEYFEKKTKLRIKQLKQMLDDVKKAKKLSSPTVRSPDFAEANADLE